MSISGTTTTCEILTNTPFSVSGLSEVNLSTINITDDNGLDVSECFGITTDIITVDGTNVTLTGDCDTSLEILITDGIINPVTCDYIAYRIGNDGVLVFDFADGTSTTNIHPDCCTALGHIPEIGPEHWWVCRTIAVIDPNDCDNYSPINQTSPEGWQLFDFVTGGTVTTVPSVECCYQYGFIESLIVISEPPTIKCILEEEPSPCDGYTVIEPVPLTGPIPFNAPNGEETTLVPAAECCTNLGYNYVEDNGSFICFQENGLTVSITNDDCCVGPE
jgi:hypothetical protein